MAHLLQQLPEFSGPFLVSGFLGKYDTPTCMKLLLEGIAWSLSGFFGGGQSRSETAPADTAP